MENGESKICFLLIQKFMLKIKSLSKNNNNVLGAYNKHRSGMHDPKSTKDKRGRKEHSVVSFLCNM